MSKLINKICTKCQVIKPVIEFYRNRRIKSGFTSWCKLCENKQKKLWREKNRNLEHKYHKRYRQRHPEQKREENRRYREKYREVLNQKQRTKYQLKKLIRNTATNVGTESDSSN